MTTPATGSAGGTGTVPVEADSDASFGLPDLPPGTDLAADLSRLREPDASPDVGPTRATNDACQSITEAGIQELIDRLSRIRGEADAEVAANGPGTGSEHPGLATRCAGFTARCEQRLTTTLVYLRDEVKAFGPSGTLVNQAGGYALYSRARENILDLHYARDQATIGAIANAKRDSSHALACVRLISEVLPDLEAHSVQATRCFLSLYRLDM